MIIVRKLLEAFKPKNGWRKSSAYTFTLYRDSDVAATVQLEPEVSETHVYVTEPDGDPIVIDGVSERLGKMQADIILRRQALLNDAGGTRRGWVQLGAKSHLYRNGIKVAWIQIFQNESYSELTLLEDPILREIATIGISEGRAAVDGLLKQG